MAVKFSALFSAEDRVSSTLSGIDRAGNAWKVPLKSLPSQQEEFLQ
ncbi:MAG: hypothetical protein GX434_18660 [Peptococcaceae bacterium]|nr:hypothetical protein [Peptococcaceae bacterium]